MTAPATILSFASAYRQLRPVEKAFVDGYVAKLERDATRAGERLSLALHRVIPADVVAASQGLLERPMVIAAITERINQISADNELTVNRVIKELMAVAFSTMGDYMQIGEDGQPWFDLTRCTPEQLSAIASVEIEEIGEPMSRGHKRKFKFKLHDKLSGMTMLARYMGLLDPENPHWRSDNARPVGPGTLRGDVSTEAAADAYSQLING